TFISIPNWQVTTSNNLMMDGETANIKLNKRADKSDWRGLTTTKTQSGSEKEDKTFSHYELFHSNSANQVFRGKARAVTVNDKKYDGKHVYDEGWAYYSVAQTVDLDRGKDYIFRMDFDTDSKAKYIVRVYPGGNRSGNGWIGHGVGMFVMSATSTTSTVVYQHIM